MTTAASSRTTKPKPKVADFDAERKRIIKNRTGNPVHEWTVYDRVWHIKRPNVAFVAEQEDRETLGAFINTLVAHVIKDERADFLAALAADEDLDFDVLTAMTTDMQGIVYADLAE